MTADQVRAGYINAGMSRRQFARHIGVSEVVVRRLEDGEPIHPSNAKKVADYFGVQVTDLMPLEPEPPERAAA